MPLSQRQDIVKHKDGPDDSGEPVRFSGEPLGLVHEVHMGQLLQTVVFGLSCSTVLRSSFSLFLAALTSRFVLGSRDGAAIRLLDG